MPRLTPIDPAQAEGKAKTQAKSGKAKKKASSE